MSTINGAPATSIVLPDRAPSSAAITTETSTVSSGRGNNRSRHRGGRGRGRGNRNRRQTRNITETFKGNTDGMKGNVFQSHGETHDKQQFLKTVGVLEEYINKTFTYPQDVATVCKTFELNEPVQPTNLTDEEYKNDMGKKMIWETGMKTYMKRMDMMESNTRAIYAIVWGQCSPTMQSKIESLEGFKTQSGVCDCIWLLKKIQGITHQFEGTRYVFLSLDDAWTAYYTTKQTDQQTLHDFLKHFQALVQVLEHYGAALGADGPYQEYVKEEIRRETTGTISTAELHRLAVNAAKKRSVGIAFLKRANRNKYANLWSDLENDFTRGQDSYPKDLTAAYNLLLNYVPLETTSNNGRCFQESDDVSGITFLQNTPATPGTNGITHPSIKCYNCNLHGHYAGDCPQDNNRNEVTMLQINETTTTTNDEIGGIMNATGDVDYESDYHSEFTFAQTDEQADYHYTFHQATARSANLIPDSWILLDSQSTVSVFKNSRLMSNIRPSTRTLQVHTNGGTQMSNHIGTVTNFGNVWYNQHSLANILSMAAVRKICRITMDTSVDAAIHVHRRDGSIMTFTEYQSGLYYFDTGVGSTKSTKNNVDAYVFLTTVAGNKLKYTRREIQGADDARALYRKLGHPSEKTFRHLLDSNYIRNCPITSDDAKRALLIYGPDIATLKGKRTRRQHPRIPDHTPVLIPAPIIEQYKTIRLFVDIFWVNGQPFFHTISQWIQFQTVARIRNRTKQTLLMELKAVMQMYHARGFVISRVDGDNEFQCITNDILPVVMNIADADDHVHEVERSIRTVKERTRCTVQGLPFSQIPRIMIRATIEAAHKSLNQIPAQNGVSQHLSPTTIVTGRPSPDYNDMSIEFGAYAQVFEDNNPSNTNRTRSTGAIALNPTGNAQGGYFFFVPRHWKETIPNGLGRTPYARWSHSKSRANGRRTRAATDGQKWTRF